MAALGCVSSLLSSGVTPSRPWAMCGLTVVTRGKGWVDLTLCCRLKVRADTPAMGLYGEGLALQIHRGKTNQVELDSSLTL